MEKLGFVRESHVEHAGLDHVLYRLRLGMGEPEGELA